MNQEIKKYGYYNSPIGLIEIEAQEDQIQRIEFVEKENYKSSADLIIKNCIEQLDNYFKKNTTTFNLPITIRGTTFQELVWSNIYKIPYGQVVTYQELANAINKPTAVRAVASAVASNKLSIIVACHRVISKNNSHFKYRWGSSRKQFLLNLEKQN